MAFLVVRRLYGFTNKKSLFEVLRCEVLLLFVWQNIVALFNRNRRKTQITKYI